MRDSDLKRIHCGLPVDIAKLPVEPRSQREHLEFTCKHCGHQETELRDLNGKLLNWRLIKQGAKHEPEPQITKPAIGRRRPSLAEWLRRKAERRV